MSVHVSIIEGPLPAHPATSVPADIHAGAILSFDGVVRPFEDNRPLLALDYTAYEPMATRELMRLSESILASHAILTLAVWQSKGRVPVGATSFRLIIRSAHRAAALAAMSEFIDRLKRDVPIWKQSVWCSTPK